MTRGKLQDGIMPSRLGQAKPPPEPAVRPRKGAGRRVGASLPAQTYVAFKTYVAQRGITGEQVIVEAIERMIGDPPEESIGT